MQNLQQRRGTGTGTTLYMHACMQAGRHSGSKKRQPPPPAHLDQRLAQQFVIGQQREQAVQFPCCAWCLEQAKQLQVNVIAIAPLLLRLLRLWRKLPAGVMDEGTAVGRRTGGACKGL
jgi:hypothetical protein